jgi:hypothetical protein
VDVDVDDGEVPAVDEYLVEDVDEKLGSSVNVHVVMDDVKVVEAEEEELVKVVLVVLQAEAQVP